MDFERFNTITVRQAQKEELRCPGIQAVLYLWQTAVPSYIVSVDTRLMRQRGAVGIISAVS